MKFKVFIVSLFFVSSLFLGIGTAQNKVVVVPLSESKVDLDGDRYHPPDDCDDNNAAVHPNAEWHRNPASGNTGWDWDCSGTIEKRYPDSRTPGLFPTLTDYCGGYRLVLDEVDVDCGTNIVNPATVLLYSLEQECTPLCVCKKTQVYDQPNPKSFKQECR